MQHAWSGYRTYAFGKDELQPLTQSSNLRWGNWSISLLDALDTLKLMDMDKEYQEAKQFVRHIDFTKSLDYYDVRVFEMIIRALGGLLGAYELDPDPLLLAKAEEVGQSLARAFDTPTGLPYASIDLGAKTIRGPYRICLAEAGTMQLEYKKLAKLTNNRKYWKMAERVSDVLEAGKRNHQGLYPMDISVLTGQYFESDYSVGAAADSFYEYLLKQYVLEKDPKYRKRYETAVDFIHERLVGQTSSGLTFIGRMSKDGRLIREQEHLACFYPGLLALGAQVLDRPQDLVTAEKLAETCFITYNMTETKLGPERVYFMDNGSNRWGIEFSDSRYILRPETLESLFILYRVTGNRKYQEWSWQIFEAIEKYARVETGGYAAILDVRKTGGDNYEDSMESFFLAETLKYLYLIFAPVDMLPLDKYVFNTEAHPLRVHK
ncbi:hypothetical protein H4R22_002063 [Coemansia sp. RSA 1290]|nr:mannosyl-oligosaccharide 1,2-alpha-mannosidase [Coemansia mojavensis]KAJ2631317.1 hypothetical protein H4R22_002063 [Coemansia sp. RSA 1290]